MTNPPAPLPAFTAYHVSFRAQNADELRENGRVARHNLLSLIERDGVKPELLTLAEEPLDLGQRYLYATPDYAASLEVLIGTQPGLTRQGEDYALGEHALPLGDLNALSHDLLADVLGTSHGVQYEIHEQADGQGFVTAEREGVTVRGPTRAVAGAYLLARQLAAR